MRIPNININKICSYKFFFLSTYIHKKEELESNLKNYFFLSKIFEKNGLFIIIYKFIYELYTHTRARTHRHTHILEE